MHKYTKQIRNAEVAFILGTITQSQMEEKLGMTFEKLMEIWELEKWDFDTENENEEDKPNDCQG